MKSILRKIIAKLPRQWRHKIARSYVRVPDFVSTDFEFKIANTAEELEQAFRILHDAYVQEGYMKASESGLRVTKYHALPTTSTIVAKFKGKVVGTMSVIRDSKLNLPLDTAFDISGIRSRQGQIAEVSSLAIQREFRLSHGELLWPLIKYFYNYSKELMMLRTIVIGVHPKWIDLYVGVMGFRIIQGEILESYTFANGNPVAGLYLDLEKAQVDLNRMYAKSRSFVDFIFGDPPSNFIIPDRRFYKVSDPVMTPELLIFFFKQKTKIFESLTLEEIEILRECYPLQSYMSFFGPTKRDENWVDRKVRFKTSCRAFAPGHSGVVHLLEVVNVSAKGLEVVGSLPEGALFKLAIAKPSRFVQRESGKAKLEPEQKFSKPVPIGTLMSTTSTKIFRKKRSIPKAFIDDRPAKPLDKQVDRRKLEASS